jgi:GNAT superfamily N-acetyltransferase
VPTRPQTWRFQAIYNGFEHRGLRTEFDRATSTPVNRAGRVVRVGGHILTGDGRRVGHFTRMLATGSDGLRARHEEIRLAEEARGRGFARALHEHSEAVYVRMEVAYVTMHAESVGSLLWPRLGFDFDLRRVEGETEAQRRAHAVQRMMSPRARKVEGQLRPAEVLVAWMQSRDPARRAAAAELRERLPTPARILSGELSGLLLDPRSIGDFDAEGTRLGAALMLGASWDGYKRLTPVT